MPHIYISQRSTRWTLQIIGFNCRRPSRMPLISQKNKKEKASVVGFFRLGPRDGRVKQLYSRSQFSICQRELISIEEVPNIDSTLRSVATAQSYGTGQGFKKCSCKEMCYGKKWINVDPQRLVNFLEDGRNDKRTVYLRIAIYCYIRSTKWSQLSFCDKHQVSTGDILETNTRSC
ncbi:CRC domain-containing protein [Trichonephila clavipes]|nr:CRC domain-containing protein [Trichonephila clavipes]